MNRIHEAAAGILALALVACTAQNPTIDKSTRDSGPVVLGASCPTAITGEMLVKFTSTATKAMTKASDSGASAVEMGSLPEQMQDVLEEAGTVTFERLFTPDPRFEERTRAEGLDRWYMVKYDGEMEPAEMAARLESVEGIEVIECSLPLTSDYEDCPDAPAFDTKGSVAAVSPFNDPYVNQMRQWDFNNTGIVANISTVAGADCNVYRAWNSAPATGTSSWASSTRASSTTTRTWPPTCGSTRAKSPATCSMTTATATWTTSTAGTSSTTPLKSPSRTPSPTAPTSQPPSRPSTTTA